MDKTIKCKIKEYSKRGFGIGYYTHPVSSEQIPVEVAHALVGDEIEAAVYKKRKRYRKGKLLNIIQPSESRIEPKCSHVGMCGGCTWQEMRYNDQLTQKQNTINKIFKKYDCEKRNIVKCDFPFNYRNKMEFSFSENRANTKFLGLMIAHASTYVFNVTECHLARPWVSRVVNTIRDWWEKTNLKAYNPSDNSGHLRTLTLRESFTDKKKMVMLTVSGNPQFALSKDLIDSFKMVVKDALQEDDPAIFLQIHQAIKGKPTQLFEMHLNGEAYIQEKLAIKGHELFFKISPTSFFQPNSKQAEKIYSLALDTASISNSDIVYDLYSGTGTLSMIFAKHAKKVISIELNAHAVCDAKENIKLNNISNIEVLQGDVGKILSDKKDLPRPDLVVVDPPRAGLDATAMQNIERLLPKKIIYISCNPYTQIENINEMSSFGYKLKILQPVDQFPHTYHIENIAYLTLES